VAAGPVGVTLVVLALASRLALARRERSLTLMRARGGSPLQVRGLLAAEGLLWCVPAAAFGAAVSTVLIPGPVRAGDFAVAALVAVTAPVVLATSRHHTAPAQRFDLAAGSSSRWRWPLEVVLVA